MTSLLNIGGLFFDRGEDEEGAVGDDVGKAEENKRGRVSVSFTASVSSSSSCLYSASKVRSARAPESVAEPVHDVYVIYVMYII